MDIKKIASEKYKYIDVLSNDDNVYNSHIFEYRENYIKIATEVEGIINAEWEEKLRWIPVEEMLPDSSNKNDLILKFMNGNFIIGKYDSNTNVFRSVYGDVLGLITHWKEII